MNESKLRRLRDQASGPATLISEGCKINGTLSGDGDFLINGEVDGDCDLTGSVTIAEKGMWKGNIHASSVIVAGIVDGEIVAEGRVEITSTARVAGTVSGEAIAVAEGAVVQGVMKTSGQPDPVEFIDKLKVNKTA